MYEVLIEGGPSDGRVLGEFHSLNDAMDYVESYNQSEHHPDEEIVLRKMEV